ncbi:hypothetical protein O3P69_015447 [Scylla paramamosain]|uniref:Uncharacterized protein n=1 Tax=Scylla paramamosain TaxID=85552 RepID=A0AAW0T4P2_SCYPA
MCGCVAACGSEKFAVSPPCQTSRLSPSTLPPSHSCCQYRRGVVLSHRITEVKLRRGPSVFCYLLRLCYMHEAQSLHQYIHTTVGEI